jgi:hypothetical protein
LFASRYKKPRYATVKGSFTDFTDLSIYFTSLAEKAHSKKDKIAMG